MKILHLFNWQLKDINKELIKVKEQGFDAVLINPIQPLKENNLSLWWLSYQPCGFAIGNQYGSKEDLINLCNSANKLGIKIFSDVICTHVAGAVDGTLNPHYKVDSKLIENPYFWKQKINIKDWNNRYEVINHCIGLPSLNLYNYDLQDIIVKFLNDLIDCGIKGFRFDSAKNIPLPEENCDFFIRVLSGLKREDIYCFGEVICCSNELLINYSKYLDVLTDNINYKSKTVVFSESHDSFYGLEFIDKNQRVRVTSSYIPTYEINNRYSQLVDEYDNVLYYARPFDDNNGWLSDKIKNVNFKTNKILIKR
ncbi:MAG: alpha-amylase family glycosyl hydrolase [Bacilli bacterium]|nr:alpha-amylase family glycosyl hydrolase [Bacilli bacterium]